MFLSLCKFFATKFLVLALHLESGSFPRPLSAREETEAFSALRAGDLAARGKTDPAQSASGGTHREKNTTPCPAIRTTLFPSAPSA